MKERIDAVLESTARLQEIRTRIAAIDEERAALEAEAAEILQRIGVGGTGTVAGEWKDARLPLSRRVISFLATRPAEQFRISALASNLGLTHPDDVRNLRGTLARLTNEQRVLRTGKGSYTGKPGAI